MGTAENKDVVRRVYEEVVNNHNVDLLSSYFSPDYVNHKNPGGLEGTKQLFLMLFGRFLTCACRWRASAPNETGCGYGSLCGARSWVRTWVYLRPEDV